MRVVGVLLAGIVVAFTVLAGLVVAFFAGALALVLALIARCFRAFSHRPSAARPTESGSGPQPQRMSRAERADAIDVTATEVPPR